MKKQLITFDLMKINITAIVMFAVPYAIAETLRFTVFTERLWHVVWWDIILLIAGYVLLLAAHEGLHALAMIMCGAKPSSVRFGVIPKQFMLYCTTDTPLSARKYAFVLVLPGIVTGLIPLALATVFLNFPYVILFAALLSGAGGDAVMFMSVCRLKPAALVLDHPEAPAYYVLYPENELPNDFVEVTEEQERELRERMRGNKR